MKPFNAEAVCPKCGHDDVHTYYNKAVPTEFYRYHHERQHGMPTEENIQRRCERCSFIWFEKPLRAEVGEG